ncbi:MAG: glycerol-3-phosphate acyltransferase [Dehalococcoidales bacterium]|nr:glycerol-3-phosphate acyltransferase [Dehalococcoidales bacterium]
MNILKMVLVLVTAYLLGSIPSAYIIGRLRKGTDIREIGSRNMGAMNTIYSVGFWWGTLDLLVDMGKGAAAVAIAQAFGIHQYAVFAAGMMAVIGHNLPVFLRFKGGKGGATALGVLFVLMPWSVLIYCGLFGILLLITRAPTISYGICFAAFPFIAWLLYDNTPLIFFSILLALIPLLRYIPRMLEMRQRGGSWQHVFKRKDLKDRF